LNQEKKRCQDRPDTFFFSDTHVYMQIEGVGEITRKQARAIEHLLIEKWGRKLYGGLLDNVYRGIDPRKLGKYESELEWAMNIIEQLGL
jgi:hypothetical protein